jgi:hypothetical protein
MRRALSCITPILHQLCKNATHFYKTDGSLKLAWKVRQIHKSSEWAARTTEVGGVMELIDQITIEEGKGTAGKRPLTIFDLITKIRHILIIRIGGKLTHETEHLD